MKLFLLIAFTWFPLFEIEAHKHSHKLCVHNHGWRSMETDAPEYNAPVLMCTFNLRPINVFVGTLTIENDHEYIYVYRDIVVKKEAVVFWQPLPKLPEYE